MSEPTTTVRMSVAARDAVYAISALVSGATEQRVNVSNSMLTALHIVRAHQDELADALRRISQESKP